MRLFVSRRLPLDCAAAAGPGIEVDVFPHDRAPTRAELLEAARSADGLVTLLSEGIDEALLAASPRLRVVANVAVGLDNVDRKACAARPIAVTHSPDVLTDATADLAWALILAVGRRVLEGDRLVCAGGFRGFSPTLLLGKDLATRTLGIVGFGRIGQAVARRGLGFGMRVVYSNRSEVPPAVRTSLDAEPASVDELVERCAFRKVDPTETEMVKREGWFHRSLCSWCRSSGHERRGARWSSRRVSFGPGLEKLEPGKEGQRASGGATFVSMVESAEHWQCDALRSAFQAVNFSGIRRVLVEGEMGARGVVVVAVGRAALGGWSRSRARRTDFAKETVAR